MREEGLTLFLIARWSEECQSGADKTSKTGWKCDTICDNTEKKIVVK